MSFERIVSLLGKGPALTALDVHEIEHEIAVMPLPEAVKYGPLAWEGVAMIISDPDYQGDAKIPEYV